MRNILIAILAIAIMGCTSQSAKQEKTLGEQNLNADSEMALLTQEEGMQMLQTHCYACHNPASISHDDILAPPLAGIKHRYKKQFSERGVFIEKMTAFVSNPTVENAMMRGPVKRFGVMPKTALKEEEIQQLTAFIYDNELPVPDWFPEHFKEHHGEDWKGHSSGE
jgi:hypothetical protein